MQKILTGTSILITAGPTWIPIDRVRVMTSIFGGRTGCLIARQAAASGANVTLLLGPGRSDSFNLGKRINLIEFRYFEELLQLVKNEVKSSKYNVMIHSAAVADYSPVRRFNGKIRSRKRNLSIKLKPTVKIVDQIKRYDPSIFLVMFKLEVNKNKNQLIDAGFRSLTRTRADLVVANDLTTLPEAIVVDSEKNTFPVKSRENLAAVLFELIRKRVK